MSRLYFTQDLQGVFQVLDENAKLTAALQSAAFPLLTWDAAFKMKTYDTKSMVG